jgi:ribokinase
VSQTPEFDVVVLGSANLDLISNTTHLPQPGETISASHYAEHPGGKGVNQAIAAARMGARTAFIGCVGNDDAGQMLRALLVSEGIDTSQLLTVVHPTGRAFITVDDNGENSIVVVSGANSNVGDQAILLPTSHIVLAQLEIPLNVVNDVFEQARKSGAITVLNPAPAVALSRELLLLCDFVVPNETECAALNGPRELLAAGASIVITTLGERGSEITTHDSTVLMHPHAVKAVDTVGAGDAFVGALCAEFARSTPLHEAVKIASIAGALATTSRGAISSLPTRSDVASHF